MEIAAPAPVHATVTAPHAAAPPAPEQIGAGLGPNHEAATPGFQTPDWVKDAVFYQIFPERFANGDTSNDPAGTVPWGTPPSNFQFQGGDLEGVTQKMGYLKDLGVTALYMNPIFVSPSNHKYDTVDFQHVDPHFGGDQALHDMVDAAHASGIKVMLDGALCNTSNEHPWFQDVVANGPKSKYWDYYKVTNWPIKTTTDANGVLRSDDYDGWFGFATLPVLDKDNPTVKQYFVDGPNSVLGHWLDDYKIDGWRMDVADDDSFPQGYWASGRDTIKAQNPNAYFAAEGWHDNSSMLKGDQFDGAMNYAYFLFPAVDFFAKKDISPDQFVQRLQNDYPAQAQYAMLNSLDTHDTERFVTQAGGDWYRQRPAAIFQMTYVGAPVVYYGDELGLPGGADPDCRRAMPWDETAAPAQGNDLRTANGGLNSRSDAPSYEQITDLYKTLISVRNQEPELRRGDFQVLATHNDNHTLSYRRALAGQTRDAIVALNDDVVGHSISIPTQGFAPDGTAWTDALSGQRYVSQNGSLTLPNVDGNYGAVLLRDVAANAQGAVGVAHGAAPAAASH